jgi:hypothetical protein
VRPFTLRFGCLCASLLFLVLAGCPPEKQTEPKPGPNHVNSNANLMNSKLAEILEQNGYTMYTPFRTTDFPGSLFFLTTNHLGRVTEWTVAEFDKTFDVPRAELFNEKGEGVDWFSKLTQSFSFDAGAGLQLASGLLDLQSKGEYISTVEIEFVDPKLKHVISLEHLAQLAPNLSDSVRNLLRNMKQNGQLENVFLVLETVQVGGVKATVRLSPRFSAEARAQKLKELVDLNANFKIASDDSVTLSADKPLIIGYKAMLVPESFLSTQIAAPDVQKAEVFPAKKLNDLKR